MTAFVARLFAIGANLVETLRTSAFLRTLQIGMFASYHPEQHYMRGPGPKWHERHQGPSLT